MKRNVLRFGFGTLLFGIGLQLQLQTLAITVTNLNDSGPGSLRQAIADAPAGETIDFAVTGTIVLTSGQLVITNDLTINGPGAANLTVSQNSTNRILVVSNGNVAISGLAVVNGYQRSFYEFGGGIENWANLTLRSCLITSNFTVNDGGGIFNLGTLLVRDSLITSNAAMNLGGGIMNNGIATILGSTICSNNAGIYYGTIAAGGIHNNRNLIVSNSTVSGNWRYGILRYGGTIVVANSTLANNQGDLGDDAGGLNTITVRNSIITALACEGFKCVSADYNLVQSGATLTCFIGATNHNIYGQDPKLGPLADNGGPTPTHALRFDSPAIDAGHSGGATTDQRGLPRPIDDPNTPNADGGDGSDIGAYEADPILKVTAIQAAGGQIQVGFNSLLG